MKKRRGIGKTETSCWENVSCLRKFSSIIFVYGRENFPDGRSTKVFLLCCTLKCSLRNIFRQDLDYRKVVSSLYSCFPLHAKINNSRRVFLVRGSSRRVYQIYFKTLLMLNMFRHSSLIFGYFSFLIF